MHYLVAQTLVRTLVVRTLVRTLVVRTLVRTLVAQTNSLEANNRGNHRRIAPTKIWRICPSGMDLGAEARAILVSNLGRIGRILGKKLQSAGSGDEDMRYFRDVTYRLVSSLR